MPSPLGLPHDDLGAPRERGGHLRDAAAGDPRRVRVDDQDDPAHHAILGARAQAPGRAPRPGSAAVARTGRRRAARVSERRWRVLADEPVRVRAHREPDEHEDVEDDRGDRQAEPPGLPVPKVMPRKTDATSAGRPNQTIQRFCSAASISLIEAPATGTQLGGGVTDGHDLSSRDCAHLVPPGGKARPRRRTPVFGTEINTTDAASKCGISGYFVPKCTNIDFLVPMRTSAYFVPKCTSEPAPIA